MCARCKACVMSHDRSVSLAWTPLEGQPPGSRDVSFALLSPLHVTQRVHVYLHLYVLGVCPRGVSLGEHVAPTSLDACA